jgi:hypothetical protein
MLDKVEAIVAPVYQVFLPVPGFEGLYEVSSFGIVRSVDRVVERRNRWKTPYKVFYPGKELRQKMDKYGYMTVCIFIGGMRKYIAVHRLVASAFIPNPKGLSQVNHKNCNKRDNRSTNLEWTTPIENIHHAMENNLQRYAKGEHLPQSKLTEPQVREIKKLLSRGTVTQSAIACAYGMSKNAIHHISKGHTWKTV